MLEVKAPDNPKEHLTKGHFSIFLGGSIDQGSAWDWQKHIADFLEEYDVVLYNPRRSNWNKNLEQSLDNPEFVQQVTWEQHFLPKVDYRVFVLTAESKAPISLLEIGQFIKQPGIILCYPEFYRRANVQITAMLNGMTVIDSMEELINHLKVVITENQWGKK